MAFHVRLTLYFLDGSASETVVPIEEAIKLDRLLKAGDMPKTHDSVIDLHYTALRELPNDDQEKA